MEEEFIVPHHTKIHSLDTYWHIEILILHVIIWLSYGMHFAFLHVKYMNILKLVSWFYML